ncbi:MAG TPA: choice-of-anchor Q domain-containing protein [bacterium]|nr:choice-of-anchor Q domain-containing protein [bacterium]
MSGPLAAATFDVTNGAELEAALATAQSNGEGDTINLAPGLYTSGSGFSYLAAATENFPISLAGTGPGVTVLDGGDAHRVLGIETTAVTPDDAGADVALSGLTIQNGEVSSAFGVGGGLRVVAFKADISLSDSVIQRNRVVPANGHSGGAFLATFDGAVTISSSVVAGNSASSGGGLRARAQGDGSITITDSLFTGNKSLDSDASGGGLAVDATNGAALVQGNHFIRNESVDNGGGAGVAQNGFGTTTFVNNVFFDNLAGDDGGGFAYDSNGAGPLNFVNNTVYANRSQGNGGGVYLNIQGDDVEALLYNSIVFGNEADGEGQDIYADDDPDGDDDGAPLTLANNNFSDFSTFCQNEGSCVTDITQTDNLPGLNPLFLDPSSDDLRLSEFSPCIDEGDLAAPDLPAVDLEGDPRVIGSAPDIGADERNVCGDGALGAEETCDDGNAADGDGCSATCQEESPGSATPSPSPSPGDDDEDDDGTIGGGGCSLQPGAGPSGLGALGSIFSALGYFAIRSRRSARA